MESREGIRVISTELFERFALAGRFAENRRFPRRISVDETAVESKELRSVPNRLVSQLIVLARHPDV